MKAPIIAIALAVGLTASPAMITAAYAQEKAASFSTDTPIEQLVADERAKAVLDKHIPNIDQHPAYGQFKTMSLKAVQPWSAGAITAEMLEKIQADLIAL
ncbi:hypothetical protein FGU71_05640 [Erythrobacter insulae]|uniref:Uncharacterized protein n=1 Tax=Erythrobacter insulae TaxID=2584124 RepID=A0A547PB65_9SPHN|nr:hypothetical protein [Erythrobacter insulae]TRD11386.1 hypothetical protein FGU71_05640 [Erythrobacter insulae]